MWHFQLVPRATLRHRPWTWRSLPTLLPPPLNLFLLPLLNCSPGPAMVWHCGIVAPHGWSKHQHLSPFPAPYPLSLSPLSLRHRSSLIRGAGAGTDWWCGQGAAGLWRLEMLGETVGWGAEQISAGARGDWTEVCPRVIASLISVPCVWCAWQIAAAVHRLFENCWCVKGWEGCWWEMEVCLLVPYSATIKPPFE